MGDATTGANRLFGRTTMLRFSELRRQAGVAASEVDGPLVLDSDFPTRVDVLRQEKTSAGSPSAGVSPTFAAVAGLTDLKGHVRVGGKWLDEGTGRRVILSDAERVVLVYDVPAGGNGAEDQVLLTDRLTFEDPLVGRKVWDVKAVRVSRRDGIASVRVDNAREELA